MKKIKKFHEYISVLVKTTFSGLSALLNLLAIISFIVSYPLNYPSWIPLLVLLFIIFYSGFIVWYKESVSLDSLKNKNKNNSIELDETERLMMLLFKKAGPEKRISIITTWGNESLFLPNIYDTLLYNYSIQSKLSTQQQIEELNNLEEKGYLSMTISENGTRHYTPTKLGYKVLDKMEA